MFVRYASENLFHYSSHCSLTYIGQSFIVLVSRFYYSIRYEYRVLFCLSVEGVLEAVGKPVFKGSMDDPHGCWMYDSSPRTEAAAEKLWVTRQINTSYIFEYKNKEDFKKGYIRNIRLPYPFKVGPTNVFLWQRRKRKLQVNLYHQERTKKSSISSFFLLFIIFQIEILGSRLPKIFKNPIHLNGFYKYDCHMQSSFIYTLYLGNINVAIMI